ncbi:hypothetical protein K2X05_05020, partial [bacterium]|nr:hypothetical protein [bacterium]
LVFFILYFFFEKNFQSSTLSPLMQSLEEQATPLITTFQSATLKNPAVQTPENKDIAELEITRAAIQKCLQSKNSIINLFQNNKIELFDLNQISPEEKSLNYLNLHYKDDDGAEKRLQFGAEAKEGPKEGVRLFKVDEEGYPERMTSPKEWEDLTQAEILKAIKHKNIHFIQKSVTWKWADQVAMTLLLENNLIKDLSFYIPTESGSIQELNCQQTTQLKCRCIQ